MSVTVGQRIRNRRRALGMTQSQLAARVSLTQTEISKLEQNEHDMRLSTLQRIARALDVPTFHFFDNAVLTTPKEVQDGRDTLYELAALIEEHQYETVLAMVKAVSDAPFFRYAHNQAELLFWKSRAYIGLRKWREAEDAARAGLVHESVLHDDTIAALYDSIGCACQQTGRPREGLEYHLKAYKFVFGPNRRRSARILRALILYNLGRVYNMLGDYTQSGRYLDRAEDAIKVCTSYYLTVMGNILHLRGSQMFRTGNAEGAYDMSVRAYEQHKANRDIHAMSEALNNAAYIAHTLGRADASKRHYDDLLCMAKNHPDKVSGRVIEELRKEGFDV